MNRTMITSVLLLAVVCFAFSNAQQLDPDGSHLRGNVTEAEASLIDASARDFLQTEEAALDIVMGSATGSDPSLIVGNPLLWMLGHSVLWHVTQSLISGFLPYGAIFGAVFADIIPAPKPSPRPPGPPGPPGPPAPAPAPAPPIIIDFTEVVDELKTIHVAIDGLKASVYSLSSKIDSLFAKRIFIDNYKELVYGTASSEGLGGISYVGELLDYHVKNNAPFEALKHHKELFKSVFQARRRLVENSAESSPINAYVAQIQVINPYPASDYQRVREQLVTLVQAFSTMLSEALVIQSVMIKVFPKINFYYSKGIADHVRESIYHMWNYIGASYPYIYDSQPIHFYFKGIQKGLDGSSFVEPIWNSYGDVMSVYAYTDNTRAGWNVPLGGNHATVFRLNWSTRRLEELAKWNDICWPTLTTCFHSWEQRRHLVNEGLPNDMVRENVPVLNMSHFFNYNTRLPALMDEESIREERDGINIRFRSDDTKDGLKTIKLVVAPGTMNPKYGFQVLNDDGSIGFSTSRAELTTHMIPKPASGDPSNTFVTLQAGHHIDATNHFIVRQSAPIGNVVPKSTEEDYSWIRFVILEGECSHDVDCDQGEYCGWSRTGYTYLGCYQDGPIFDLPYKMGRGLSHDQCYSMCVLNRGYAYFSLQFDRLCRCGDSYGKYGAPTKPCRYQCSERADNFGSWTQCMYRAKTTHGSCFALPELVKPSQKPTLKPTQKPIAKPVPTPAPAPAPVPSSCDGQCPGLYPYNCADDLGPLIIKYGCDKIGNCAYLKAGQSYPFDGFCTFKQVSAEE